MLIWALILFSLICVNVDFEDCIQRLQSACDEVAKLSKVCKYKTVSKDKLRLFQLLKCIVSVTRIYILNKNTDKFGILCVRSKAEAFYTRIVITQTLCENRKPTDIGIVAFKVLIADGMKNCIWFQKKSSSYCGYYCTWTLNKV